MATSEKKQELLNRYERIMNELRDEMEGIKADLDELEASGEAKKYPDKHRKALKKVHEITQQLDQLESVFGRQDEEADDEEPLDA